MLWPVYISLSFIKNLDRLAWLSFISNILMITGFICIFFHIFETLHNPAQLPAVAPARDLPLFFASAIFTYESIGLILPLENEIRNPKRFPPLLNLGMAFVTVLYISMGFFGYLSCTDKCKGSITLNLGETPFSVAVRAMMSSSIFLTYFIQAYVPFTLIESWVLEYTAEGHEALKSCGVRAGVVTITAILASTVPHLEYIIGLFGATTSTTLSITLPPLLHSMSVPKLSKFTLAKNIVIILCGITVNIMGTAVLIGKIIQLYQQPVVLAGKA
ncbi:proton-coupled amino acid transporter 4 isoform X2 [Paramuricea clavata]|uniref:Proton-coupled amino acid transporter 4 isoform X2 n=2 Tax=Paramuricea clavata TaxID=317549 RepID=A0A6S7GXU0_PARCT|nr:proton-coupled amino acid transporter 4 isoform X2 [Paramuricea clavata]